jgi:thymidylate synthase (FAD)
MDDVQDLVAYCAKVSNPQFQNQFDSAERLLNYLIAHQHWSPFEMASATIEIVTTRDIARQILRHRSFSFQEFSQRYADVNKLSTPFVLREARLQHATNRQDSIDIEDEALQTEWEGIQQEVLDVATAAYKWALSKGIAKEVARAVLPEGLTVSKLYMHGTLRSWIHYISLRSGNGTQKEHMQVAREVAAAIAAIFPMSTSMINHNQGAH